MESHQVVDVIFAVLGGEKLLIYGKAFLHQARQTDVQRATVVDIPVAHQATAEVLEALFAARNAVTLADVQQMQAHLPRLEWAVAHDPRLGGSRVVLMAELSTKAVLSYAPLLRQGPRLPRYTQPDVQWQQAPMCDPTFVAAMRQAWTRLDLQDRTQFSADECLLLQFQRMHGLRRVYEKGLGVQGRTRSPESHHYEWTTLQTAVANLIGDKLFALLGPEEVAQWWPYHDLAVWPGRTDRAWTLRCASLCPHATREGRLCYYAEGRPTLTLQGKRRVVAFAPHAIHRIAERLAAPGRSWATMGDIFNYVHTYRYFEPAELYPRQPAFAMYQECLAGHVSACYADAILDAPDPHVTYAYRMGYCPVVEDGDVWVATTVLMPGFTGTPEYGVLQRASLGLGVKERMLEQCQALSYTQVATTGDFSLLRWFHTHGVPQVIPCPPNLMDIGG
jgi:hypothetical protein